MASPIRVFFCLAICLVFAGQSLLAHDPHDPIACMALSPNFSQDRTIFAATGLLSIKVGIFPILKSTDGGVTWTVVPGLPNNNAILSIAISPGYSQDKTLYTAGAGGLFRSTNQGASWAAVTTQALVSVTLSPNFSTDNTLFVVTKNNSIHMSANRGQTWQTLAVPASLTAGLTVMAVSPNYATDKTLLLGSAANGIFKSTTGGSSWAAVATAVTSQVNQLAYSPTFSSDDTVFAGTFSGFLVSTNAGSSWKASNSGLSDTKVTSLAFSPHYSTDSTLWASTAVGGVFQSTNQGASWTLGGTVSRTLSTLTNIHYQTVSAATSGSAIALYLGMYEGVWTSSAASISWQYIDTLPTRLIRHINLSPNYANDQTVFANSYGGANLWSTSGGATWTFQNTGMLLPFTDASGISPNYAVDGTAFSGDANGLQKTTNSGATWSKLTGNGQADYPRAFAISPNYALDSTVLVGATNTNTAYEGLFLSTNGGSTWTATNVMGTTVTAIAFSPAFASDRTAFAADTQVGLYKSTNGGATWTLLTLPGTSQLCTTVVVSPSFATDRTVFAGGLTGGIFKSINGGSSWTVLPQTSSLRALDIQLSPNFAADQTMFVGTFQYGLMESTQGGQNLAQITAYPDNLVLAVGLSPNFASDDTMFAASYHGLFKSTDAGATWAYTTEPARIEDTQNVTSNSPPQQPPAIVYSSGWSSVSAPLNASTYAYTVTETSGATATLTFTGTGVRWISVTGPTQGSATVQLDGATQGTVSLNLNGSATTTAYQQNVWEQHGLACAHHTFTVTATPQASQTVTLDAFDIWVDGCPETN